MFDLPFGSGRKFLNRKGVLDDVAGGWSTNTTFTAQTGNPFSVTPTAIRLVSGGNAAGAVKIRNPVRRGGSFHQPRPEYPGGLRRPDAQPQQLVQPVLL